MLRVLHMGKHTIVLEALRIFFIKKNSANIYSLQDVLSLTIRSTLLV